MKEKYITKECKYHGETEFILEPSRNSYRCKKCRSNNVSKRRRKVKEKLVNVFGGKCILCNYSKYIGALDFHHLNPNEKDFTIAHVRQYKFDDIIKSELDKCLLVCSNCHREIHGGL